MNSTVDLRTCKPGQKLISKHGMILTYVGPSRKTDYYDHVIKYPDGTTGTRIHSGHVYRNPLSRLEDDHDVMYILPVSAKLENENDVSELIEALEAVTHSLSLGVQRFYPGYPEHQMVVNERGLTIQNVRDLIAKYKDK